MVWTQLNIINHDEILGTNTGHHIGTFNPTIFLIFWNNLIENNYNPIKIFL